MRKIDLSRKLTFSQLINREFPFGKSTKFLLTIYRYIHCASKMYQLRNVFHALQTRFWIWSIHPQAPNLSTTSYLFFICKRGICDIDSWYCNVSRPIRVNGHFIDIWLWLKTFWYGNSVWYDNITGTYSWQMEYGYCFSTLK